MKTLKRTVSILLCVLLLVSAAPLAGLVGLELPGLGSLFATKAEAIGESGACGNNLNWQWVRVTGRGLILGFTGSGAMDDYTVTVSNGVSHGNSPWDQYVFADAANASRIMLSFQQYSTITHIGDNAFSDFPAPLSIDGLPDTLQSIGECAFNGCTFVNPLRIPKSVTQIEKWFFKYNGDPDPAPIAIEYEGTLRQWNAIDMPAETRAYLEQDLTILSPTLTYGAFEYEVTADNEIRILDCTDATTGTLVVPDTIDGKPVTIIGEKALNPVYAKKICFSNNLKAVEKEGVRDIYLENVIYNDYATVDPENHPAVNFGEKAFYFCHQMATNALLVNAATIGRSAFKETGLTGTITFTDKLISIGPFAFEDVQGIGISLPASVVSIGEWQTSYDTSHLFYLPVTYASTVIQWNSVTMSSTTRSFLERFLTTNPYFTDGDFDYEFINNNTELRVVRCSTAAEGTVTVPASVNGYPVTAIGNYAFEDCDMLVDINLPASITSIGMGILKGCYVDNVYVDAANPVYTTIESGASVKETLTGRLVVGTANSSPSTETLSAIGAGAYYGLNSLEAIVLPEGLTVIEDHAFCECENLTDVTLPSTLTTIGDYAFDETGLTEISLPRYLTSVGEWISDWASPSTMDVYYDNTYLSWTRMNNGAGAGSYFSGYCNMTYAPDHIYVAPLTYYTEDYCSFALIGCDANYGGTVNIPAQVQGVPVTAISEKSFFFSPLVSTINIPASVTCVEPFAGPGLSYVNVDPANPVYHSDGDCVIETATCTVVAASSFPIIPDDGSVTKIGPCAFYGQTSWGDDASAPWLPDCITEIEEGAFAECTNLSEIWLPQGLETLGGSAFAWTSITSIYFPEGVREIGPYVFYDDTALTEVFINKDIQTIGEWLPDYTNADPASIHVYYYGNRSEWNAINMSADTRTYLEQNIDILGVDNGEVIEYGVYPQSAVEDPDLCGILNDLAGPVSTWTSYGYYTAGDYGAMAPSSAFRYTDVTWQNRTFRGVCFDEARPTTTYTGANQSRPAAVSDVTGSISWFAFDPLRWRVLDTTTGLVICEDIIDSSPYQNYVLRTTENGLYRYYGDAARTYYASDYARDDLRAWLIDDFYNTAFNQTEQANILTTALNNDCYMTLGGSELYHAYDAPATNDKIFLLSYTDTENSDYGYPGEYVNQVGYPALQAAGTDYAKFQGLYVGDNGNSCWWLRTPRGSGDEATAINEGGSFEHMMDVTCTTIGVRPAMCLEALENESGELTYGPLTYSYNYNLGLRVIACDPSYQGVIEIPGPDDFGIPVVAIDECAFVNCTGVTGVIIPSSVTEIGDDAFRSCTALESVSIPGSVLRIGNYAFRGCESLQTVTIGDGVRVIGESAFMYCDALETITVPGSARIGDSAFRGCTSLENLTLQSGVSYIGAYAFYDCDSLQTVTIPGSVIMIDDYAFRHCDLLSSVIIEDGVSYIGSYVFLYSMNMSAITIPASVTEIGEWYTSASTVPSGINMTYGGTSEQWGQITMSNLTRNYLEHTPTYNLTLVDSLNDTNTTYTWILSMTLPTPTTDEDRVFIGWASTSTGTPVYQGGDVITLTSDTTLYARWRYNSLIGDNEPANGGYVYLNGFRWQVIGRGESSELLISENATGTINLADALDYCADSYDNDFTPEEQAAILETSKNADYYMYRTMNANFIGDELVDAHIFMLSAAEAETYYATNDDRSCNDPWWTRSTNPSNSRAALGVNASGSIAIGNVGIATRFGARPAFQLDLDRVVLTSDAGSDKVPSVDGQFYPFTVTPGADQKLTLIKDDLPVYTHFTASADKTAVCAGDALTVSYSRASTSDVVISAMICDAQGSILYYGSVLKTASHASGGTWDMTVPADLPAGDYTLRVFFEMQNGTQSSDYTSNIVDLPLTVNPTFVVGGHSLCLDGDIGVVFYVAIPEVTEDAYAEFTVAGETRIVPIVMGNYATLGGERNYRFPCPVHSAQASKEITAVFHNGDNVSEAFTYSVNQYLDEVSEKPAMQSNVKLMTLMQSLATYTFYANVLLNYDPDFSMSVLFDNSPLVDIDAAALADYAQQVSDTSNGVSWYGASLELLTETTIKIYFRLRSGQSIDDFRFMLGSGQNATELTPVPNGSLYSIEIPDIASGRLANMYTVNVIKKSNGNTVNTWSYAALSYAHRVLANSESASPTVSQAQINLAKALANYYYAAKSYWNL